MPRKQPALSSWGKISGGKWFNSLTYVFWLVVSTPLKNIGQIGNLPQIGVKIKSIWVATTQGTIFMSIKSNRPWRWDTMSFINSNRSNFPWSGSNHVIGPLRWDMSLEWSPKGSAPAESCDLATSGLLGEFAPCPGFFSFHIMGW